MKKILIALSFVLSLVIVPVHASDVSVDRMTITATLDEHGNAHIQEIWDMDVYEGTEIYKIMDNMNDKKISHLKVVDEKNNQYTNIEEWDVSASREEKRNKSGLIIDGDHYELCFGIGDYGHRTYTFEYDVSHFVEQLDGDQGFNFAFFSDLELDIDEVNITIEYPGYDFTKNNSEIYAFGYEGYVVFSGGKVIMSNDEPLDNGSNKMQILMRIDDGTFHAVSRNDRTFDDILKEAKEGSDYNLGFMDILMIIGGILIGLLVVVIIVIVAMNKETVEVFDTGEKIEIKKDQVQMFRDIPCDKDLFKFYYLAKKIGLITDVDKSGLISAVLLKWVRDGNIEFKKTEGKQLLFFKKEGFFIDLDKHISINNPFEQKLLDFLKLASGENMALEDGELEAWSSKNYEKIEDWFADIDAKIDEQLKAERLITAQRKVMKRLGFINDKYVELTYTASLREEMYHIAGLKLFLNEMSSIDEKEVIEVKLWEEYLIFASILGIAEKVEKQLGKLCPQFSEQSNIDIHYTTHTIRRFSHSSVQSAQVARAAGQGGSSSFGGGGSFSGGGGGGVR